jgi:hypothetical protein
MGSIGPDAPKQSPEIPLITALDPPEETMTNPKLEAAARAYAEKSIKDWNQCNPHWATELVNHLTVFAASQTEPLRKALEEAKEKFVEIRGLPSGSMRIVLVAHLAADRAEAALCAASKPCEHQHIKWVKDGSLRQQCEDCGLIWS